MSEKSVSKHARLIGKPRSWTAPCRWPKIHAQRAPCWVTHRNR